MRKCILGIPTATRNYFAKSLGISEESSDLGCVFAPNSQFEERLRAKQMSSQSEDREDPSSIVSHRTHLTLDGY